MNANEQAVAALLAEYQDALNQSDTDAVMKLYASDGVFMPQHFPPALEPTLSARHISPSSKRSR
jgi:ketosteroid isomerase-like protein